MTHTPWYHWPISVLALLWYAVSVVDYALTRFQIDAWLAYFTPDQLAYFQALPLWVTVGWAIGVWCGLAGAMLMLRKNRNAAVLMALSFVGLLAAAVGLLYVTHPSLVAVTGPLGMWMLLGAIALAFLFFLYARTMNVSR